MIMGTVIRFTLKFSISLYTSSKSFQSLILLKL